MGLNTALATAGRSLEVFSTGIQVAGQNISNSSTPGYIRERLVIEPNSSYSTGSLILGTGVLAQGVRQEIDLFLETRIHTANGEYEASAARELISQQLEGEVNELTEGDLSTGINKFLAAINDVANQPESVPFRQFMLEEGGRLTDQVRSLRNRLDNLRSDQTIKVKSLVEESNRLIDEVQGLNDQILRSELGGLLDSDAGALRTQRYKALNRLSEIIPIRSEEQSDGSVNLFVGSTFLILGGNSQKLEVTSKIDRNVNVTEVRLDSTRNDVSTLGGELRGVIEGRDQILGGYVDELNTYTTNLIREFNKIHAAGEGTQGFEELTSIVRVNDVAAALNQAGLDFDPEHGSFQVKLTNSLTGLTETTNIRIDLDGIGADTSLDDLRSALDAVDNLSASITTDNRLVVTADDSYEFKLRDDTSGILASLGLNTFFTGKDSSDFSMNSVVANDQAFLAISLGGGPADGSNAVRLTDFHDTAFDGLGGESLNDYYDSMISSLAQSSASEAVVTNGLSSFSESLRNQREQFSGVSLDEEAIKMLEFQRAFQAAARMITTINEMYSILLSI